jgi:hypothetical protein
MIGHSHGSGADIQDGSHHEMLPWQFFGDIFAFLQLVIAIPCLGKR